MKIKDPIIMEAVLSLQKRLRLYRNQRHISLRALQKETGIDFSALAKIERGEVIAGLDTIEKIVRVLKLSLVILPEEKTYFDEVNNEMVQEFGNIKITVNKNTNLALLFIAGKENLRVENCGIDELMALQDTAITILNKDK